MNDNFCPSRRTQAILKTEDCNRQKAYTECYINSTHRMLRE